MIPLNYNDHEEECTELDDMLDSLTRHESIRFVIDDGGNWYGQTATRQPGCTEMRWWRIMDEDDLHEQLTAMLEGARS